MSLDNAWEYISIAISALISVHVVVSQHNWSESTFQNTVYTKYQQSDGRKEVIEGPTKNKNGLRKLVNERDYRKQMINH